MSLTESLDRIVRDEAQELEAQGIFELIDKHEWAIDRYRELYDEAMADRADDAYENEWMWFIIEGNDPKDDLRALHQEFVDSYAANELGDELWERGIDPWDEEMERLAEDMQRDADIEGIMMCRAADAEEAYFKKEREDAARAKRIREEVQKKWTF